MTSSAISASSAVKKVVTVDWSHELREFFVGRHATKNILRDLRALCGEKSGNSRMEPLITRVLCGTACHQKHPPRSPRPLRLERHVSTDGVLFDGQARGEGDGAYPGQAPPHNRHGAGRKRRKQRAGASTIGHKSYNVRAGLGGQNKKRTREPTGPLPSTPSHPILSHACNLNKSPWSAVAAPPYRRKGQGASTSGHK